MKTSYSASENKQQKVSNVQSEAYIYYANEPNSDILTVVSADFDDEQLETKAQRKGEFKRLISKMTNRYA